MEDPYFRNLARTRWNTLRSGPLATANLEAAVDSLVLLLNDAQVRNYERWPILGQYIWPNYDWENNTYEDEVEYFENFLVNRLQWMDQNLQGSVLTPETGINAEGNKIRLFIWGDRFRNKVLDPDYFSLNDAPEGLSIEEIEYVNPSECLITLSGDISQFPAISVSISGKIVNTLQNLTSATLESSGINEQLMNHNISVISANDNLIIRSNRPDLLPESAEIFSVSGQILQTVRLNKTEENTVSDNFKPGVYLLKLNGKADCRTIKFIVTK